MAHLASGGSWWLRYVIVPIIGGGGLVAVLATVAERADLNFLFGDAPKHVAAAQVSAPASAPSPATIPSPLLQTVQPSASASLPASAPASPPLPAAAQSPLPQTVDPSAPPKTKETHRPYFYATDKDDRRYPGQSIVVQKGDSVGLHWEIYPGTVTGVVHLRSETGGVTVSDTIVDNAGSQSIEVASSMRLVLTEVRPEGERFLADLDISVGN